MALKKLTTPYGESLPAAPWSEYPRPQLRRDSFLCLNGAWDLYTNGQKTRVLVPFAPPSPLSGVEAPGETLQYVRTFTLPEGFVRGRVLLHIGAASQVASVSLNGHTLCEHRGGYLPIDCDITSALQNENTLTVTCHNELEAGVLPYGKQKTKRGGMWYTPICGIWQSVWLESVPESYVRSLTIDVGETYAVIRAEGVDEGTITVQTPDGPLQASMVGGVGKVTIQNPRLWCPEDPYLYEFTLRAGEDEVASYFALRTLCVKRVRGRARLCLNGKPVFFNGLLDQGYYPDGIFTPASPEAYKADILFAKKLGFNMLRKHIKIEPEFFYYYCDKLGMVVFQDMVNNGRYSFLRDTALPTVGIFLGHGREKPGVAQTFARHMEDTARHLYNHPCICYYTIFNEGWGQHDAAYYYDRLKKIDPTRFVDTASGWFDAPSDVTSLHEYFKKVKLPKSDKPIVLSEFGGYSLPVPGHTTGQAVYGYKKFTDPAAFAAALKALYHNEIFPLVEEGLCAAVYTQLSDIEDEVNGLITYDRRVEKIESNIMQ